MKSERKRIIDRLDDLTREAAKVMYHDCVFCHRQATDTVHIFGKKAFPSTRWDLKNIVRACNDCHIDWGHKNPNDFMDWAKRCLGDEEFDALSRRAHTVTHQSVSMLREIEQKLLLEMSERGLVI
jgi:hypothetical protein